MDRIIIHKKRMSENGFTLMELLIVLALIAVMSLIAVPIYQGYIQRARITEGVTLASGIQLEAEIYYAMNGKWPSVNDAHNELNLPAADQYTGNSVDSIHLSGNKITVTFGENVEGEKSGEPAQLILEGDAEKQGVIRWKCSGKNLKSDDLPRECA